MGNRKNNCGSRTASNNTTSLIIPINEFVLTPLSCASIVNEIIKYLIYQKSQIPYPYNWLKVLIDKKRNMREENSEIRKPQFAAERYYRVVSNAFDTLEEMMNNINEQFERPLNGISKVLVLFGATPYSPKEAYTIHCSNQLQFDNNADHHKTEVKKNQHKVLRKIFLSEEWLSAMDTNIPTMNMFILLRKQSSNSHSQTSFFAPNEKFSLPSNVRNVNIVLSNESFNSSNCYLHFDESETDNVSKQQEDHVTDGVCHNMLNDIEASWYQANSLFKGFKDCFVNKIPASDLW